MSYSHVRQDDYNFIYGNGQRMAMYATWGHYYYYNDMLGSTREFARSDRSYVYRRRFQPYGAVLWSGGASTLASPEHLEFSGKEQDVETGLHYFGARYYDSDLGRWTQPDPLWYQYPGLSPYNYALNNPLKYVDPDGRKVVNKNSPYARDIKKALMRTKTGVAAWKRMDNSKVMITLKIDLKSRPLSPKGTKVSGKTDKIVTYDKDGNATGGTATITLYSAYKEEYAKSHGYSAEGLTNLTEAFLNIVAAHESMHPEIGDKQKGKAAAEQEEKKAQDDLTREGIIKDEEKENQ